MNTGTSGSVSSITGADTRSIPPTQSRTANGTMHASTSCGRERPKDASKLSTPPTPARAVASPDQEQNHERDDAREHERRQVAAEVRLQVVAAADRGGGDLGALGAFEGRRLPAQAPLDDGEAQLGEGRRDRAVPPPRSPTRVPPAPRRR